MIIESVRVRNFRCIRDETLPCEELTVLVGPNGSGKSSFLQALYLFYTPVAKYTEDDFFGRDTSQDIVITITFIDLTEDERELFRRYLESGKLTVEKEINWPQAKGNQKYYGTSLKNSEFDPFRSAKGAIQLRQEYNKLRENGYSDWPNYKNKDDAEKVLQEWEESHPDQCSRQRDEGQFFGFKEVGECHLERYTRFILVPAVRDASDEAADRTGTLLTEIMDLVVRSALAQREEIKEFQEGAQKRYEDIMDPANLAELKRVEQDLSDTLKTYVPDAGVQLKWLTQNVIEIPMPKADIKLIEDGYPSAVECTGHGLQRVFILTMLQHLATLQLPIQEGSESSLSISSLIIGIEEPELYQHPNRQRNLSKILLDLASKDIKGVVERIQIIYTTHSPLFVDIDRFEKVRVLRKMSKGSDKPKDTELTFTNLSQIAKIIEKADEKPEGTYSAITLKSRLLTLMTPWMNEGFFADLAVLVEGEQDRAAILGVASALGSDLESTGISVIPCMGKNNLDKPTAIFRELHIPVYVIWDSDCGKPGAQSEDNHRLLRLFGEKTEDWPEKVTEQFACFKKTLKETLCTEIGEKLFDDILKEECDRLCLDRSKDAYKNPKVIQNIIYEARKKTKSSETLEKIISKIDDMRKRGNQAASPGG